MCCGENSCYDDDGCCSDSGPRNTACEKRCYLSSVTVIIVLPWIMGVIMLFCNPGAHPTAITPDDRDPHLIDGSPNNVTVVEYGKYGWFPWSARGHLTPDMLHTRIVSLVDALVFSALIVLLMVCYYRTHLTDPGGLSDWHRERPDLFVGEREEEEEDLDLELLGGDPAMTRHCESCNAAKPPRVHHCSYCERCVLRMDHHCPFVANCVGFLNMKYFLLFLFYVTIATAFYLCIFVGFMISLTGSVELSARARLVMAITIPLPTMTTFVTFMSVATMLVWNLYLVARNLTNIEHYKMSKKTRDSVDFTLYNRGVYKNFQHVLGSEVMYWLVPVRRPVRHVKR